jgi:hypothetical protein
MTTASGGFATFTSTISAINGLLTITSTQNFTLKFGTNTTASASKVLGFAAADSSAPATSQVGTLLPYFATVNSLCINVPESSMPSWSSGSGCFGSILIPLDVSFNALKYYRRDDFPHYLYFDQPKSVINVQVRDTSNNIVSLNGFEWEWLSSE